MPLMILLPLRFISSRHAATPLSLIGFHFYGYTSPDYTYFAYRSYRASLRALRLIIADSYYSRRYAMPLCRHYFLMPRHDMLHTLITKIATC